MRNISKYTAIIVAIMSFAVAQTQGQLSIDTPLPVEFGGVLLTDFVEQFPVVKNDDNFQIGISTVEVEDSTGQFWVDGNQGGVFLSQGFEHLITVTFSPTSWGDANAVLVVTGFYIAEDGDDPIAFEQRFPMVGTGVTNDDPCDLVNAILAFFDQSVTEGGLIDTGNSQRVKAIKNRIKAVSFLCTHGHLQAASNLTQTIIVRTDGADSLNDFVQGYDLEELNDQLRCLKVLLDFNL